MKSEFELAYALFLTDRNYRKAMIDCGVNALLKEMDGMYLALLAGGDFDDTPTLLENFKKAALECGLILPADSEASDWLLDYGLQNELFLDVDKEFKRNIRFIYSYINNWSESSLKSFVHQFGMLTGNGGGLDDYGNWFDHLDRLSKQVEVSDVSDFHKYVVTTLMNVIDEISYSVISVEALNESRNLVRLLAEEGS